MFRQEITSKYPAYNPPPPLVPLEADSNSILPPATSSLGRIGNDLPRGGIGPANINSDSNSILLQPVHIATPAPSPPPSPVGPGGKAGKKQNYQTNQNFPFLYPPLDVAGGESVNSGRFPDRASAEKWKGGDVPASILEAGELFAGRMRMSRSLKQLWDERERYMEFERGWASADVDHNPDSLRREDQAVSNHIDPDVTRRLEMIEEFYVSRVEVPCSRMALNYFLPEKCSSSSTILSYRLTERNPRERNNRVHATQPRSCPGWACGTFSLSGADQRQRSGPRETQREQWALS